MKNVIKTTRRIVGDVCYAIGGAIGGGLILMGTAIGRDDTLYDFIKVLDPVHKACGFTANLSASDGETIEIGV